MIDAMSSLGGVTVDWQASQADFIVSSANKCVQGIPGFGFVLAKLSSLHKCQGMYVLSNGSVRAVLTNSKRVKPYGWSSLEVMFNIKNCCTFQWRESSYKPKLSYCVCGRYIYASARVILIQYDLTLCLGLCLQVILAHYH